MPSVRRASIFLKDHGLRKQSLASRCLLLLADIGLIAGLFYYCSMVDDDWDYWQHAPYPFHVFIVC